jgi:hypothetical protein
MNNSDIIEAKQIKDLIQHKINEANKKYYKDVLDFMNMLFETEEESILKIKIKKMTLNEDIVETYNYIIDKYKLKKQTINTKELDFDAEYEIDDIIKISTFMTNNLLDKLNYKMTSYKYHDKRIFKISNEKK